MTEGAERQMSVDEVDLLVRLFEEGCSITQARVELARVYPRAGSDSPKRDRKTIKARHDEYSVAKEVLDREERGEPAYSQREFEKRLSAFGLADGHLFQRTLKALRTYRTNSDLADRIAWRRMHHQHLQSFVQQIKSYVSSVDYETISERNGSCGLLHLGRDYSLEPLTWIELVVPRIPTSDEREPWVKVFLDYQEHLKRSPLWTHLHYLRTLANKLEKQYEKACSELTEPSVRDLLLKTREYPRSNRYRRRVSWNLDCSRPSGDPRSELVRELDEDANKQARPFAGEDETNAAVELLHKSGYPAKTMTRSLLETLKQINGALEPENMDLCIASGRCERCRLEHPQELSDSSVPAADEMSGAARGKQVSPNWDVC